MAADGTILYLLTHQKGQCNEINDIPNARTTPTAGGKGANAGL